MSNEHTAADVLIDQAIAPVDVTARFRVAGFAAPDFKVFTKFLLSNGDEFALEAVNGETEQMQSPSPDPTYIARARTIFSSWPGPGNAVTLTFNEPTPILPDRPHVMLHVEGGTTANPLQQQSLVYAHVILEEFEEFPITLNLRHSDGQQTFVTSLTALDNGTFVAFSDRATDPLVAVDIMFPGHISAFVEVNVDGAHTNHFPVLPPESRRIRVILDQSIIDPPK